jgi:hypothetical protein
LHGGNAGRPIDTGRYSIKRTALIEKAQAFMADSNPADLTGELVLMRTLLQDYLDRFEDGVKLPYDDIERIFGMIEAIGRMIERIAKILNSTALTQAEVQYLQARIADLLTVYVPDAIKRAQFMAELSAAVGVPSGHRVAGYIEAE